MNRGNLVNIFTALSLIGTIYTATKMVESMRQSTEAKARETEMLALLRSIDARLAARG